MQKKDIIAFAERVSVLDTDATGAIVHSLMLTRGLSKVVRGLDKLAQDETHHELAQRALKKLGFD